jgi:uncharacterized protein
MKASKVAAVVTALLATDAKPTEASILAAILAADKKGKDEEGGGLGPVLNQNKAKDEKEKAEDAEKFGASDAAAEYFGKTKDEWEKMPAKDRAAARDKARDEKDDPEHTNDEETNVEGMDDVQPKQSVTGGGKPAGNAGEEPAKDKEAHDAAIKLALDARDALHAARRDVETVLGVVAYDSAAQVYKAALDKLGVDTTGVHSSALATLFRVKREAVSVAAPTMASDASTVKTMAGVIKGYDRLAAR